MMAAARGILRSVEVLIELGADCNFADGVSSHTDPQTFENICLFYM